jgi:hypothetical protein
MIIIMLDDVEIGLEIKMIQTDKQTIKENNETRLPFVVDQQ